MQHKQMGQLAEKFRISCDRSIASLRDLHDDFACTRMLWNDMLIRVTRYNENPTVINAITGSRVEGSELAAKARSSIQRLRIRVYKDLIAQFELFVAELLQNWLTDKPQSLHEKSVTIRTILSSTDLAAVQSAAIREAVDSTVADKLFGKPEKWFRYLRTTIDPQIGSPGEEFFVEMKARRDILEHHGGIVEASYAEKAGKAARYKRGDQIELTEADVDDAYTLVCSLVLSTTDLARRSA